MCVPEWRPEQIRQPRAGGGLSISIASWPCPWGTVLGGPALRRPTGAAEGSRSIRSARTHAVFTEPAHREPADGTVSRRARSLSLSLPFVCLFLFVLLEMLRPFYAHSPPHGVYRSAASQISFRSKRFKTRNLGSTLF